MPLLESPGQLEEIDVRRDTRVVKKTRNLVQDEIEESLRYPHRSPTSLDDAVATCKPIDIAGVVDGDDRQAPPQVLMNKFIRDGFDALREEVLFKVIRIRDVNHSLLTHLLMDAFLSGEPAVLGDREFRVRDAKLEERHAIVFSLEPYDPAEAPWNAMLNR